MKKLKNPLCEREFKQLSFHGITFESTVNLIGSSTNLIPSIVDGETLEYHIKVNGIKSVILSHKVSSSNRVVTWWIYSSTIKEAIDTQDAFLVRLKRS